MSRAKYYVFDIDNTLIYTDELNTASYLWALEQKGRTLDWKGGRITKEVVREEYPHLTKEELIEISALKQQYFLDHLELTQVNEEVKALLENIPRERCVMWTSAHPLRVRKMLEYYGVCDAFVEARFTEKEAVHDDAAFFCKAMKCTKEELVFLDDADEVITRLRATGLTVIDVKKGVSGVSIG